MTLYEVVAILRSSIKDRSFPKYSGDIFVGLLFEIRKRIKGLVGPQKKGEQT
jgi:hypothetical protein